MTKYHFLYFQKQIFTTIVTILLGIQNIFSQPQNFELKQISEEHGLPGVTVRAIFQDSKHILWFGVESAGLCRYDGVTFTLYTNNSKDSSALGNNFVNTICEDIDGYLWIGTDDGLYRFNRISEKFTSYYPIKNNKNSLYGNQIYSIKVDINGELWVGTNKGVNIYDKKNDKFIRLPYLEKGKELNFQVNSICFDNNKNIWLGTLEGLFKLESGSHNYTRWVNISQQPNSLPNNQIKSLCFDQQGNLWIIIPSGCVKYDLKHNHFYNLNELNRSAFTSLYGSPAFMTMDSKGFIWISAEGLVIVNPKNNTFKLFQKKFDNPNGLKSNDIRAIYEDKSGLIWIGTKFEGVQIYNYRKELFPYWKNQVDNNRKGLNDNCVYSICEDNNQNLWIGTRDGGLNLFDRKTGTFTYYIHNKNDFSSISENNVYVLIADHKNNLWMATSNYLEQFDIQRKTFTHYPIKGIWSLMEDPKGNIWIGKRPGLFIFDKTKSTLTAFHDPNKVFPEKNDLDIYKLYQDKGGKIWIGSYRDGLFEYNPNTGKVYLYRNNPKDSTTLSDDMIRSIYEDKKGRLWIGTRLQGLNLFDCKNKRFITYTKNHGLPSNSIYCILEDARGNLWLATHNGISKFNPESKIFENFNKDFGLQDNIFASAAYCMAKSGELLLGGNSGFNIFMPEKIKKEIYFSPLVITSIKIFDQTIYRDLSKPVNLTLPYDKNYLSFSFALLDYYNPLKNQFEYKMENVDKNWINCGNRHYASYSSLTPGTYIFSVKAANAYGTWNENSLSIVITILSPWWKTWWFKLLVFGIFASSIYVIFYLRVDAYRKKQNELTILVRQRTTEISQANEILIERQTRIEEYADELQHQTENLRETNNILLDKQKLIEQQANQLKDTNQKLNDTNQQLSVLNSTKDRFFSIIAHDLRNPFHTVSGFAEILIKDYKTLSYEKIDRFLKLIFTSSINGNKLLENLLQWSRSQTGRIAYDPVNLNLSTIIQEVINLLDGDALHKNISLQPIIDHSLTVLADENMVKTILRNLISNAIKFTPNNGSIFIKTTSMQNEVEVTIEDTGVGIPTDTLPRLFQIDKAITTKGTAQEPGTGLGLLLCKEFIEKHNGKIWIKSEVGKGSKFRFTLPLA